MPNLALHSFIPAGLVSVTTSNTPTIIAAVSAAGGLILILAFVSLVLGIVIYKIKPGKEKEKGI